MDVNESRWYFLVHWWKNNNWKKFLIVVSWSAVAVTNILVYPLSLLPHLSYLPIFMAAFDPCMYLFLFYPFTVIPVFLALQLFSSNPHFQKLLIGWRVGKMESFKKNKER